MKKYLLRILAGLFVGIILMVSYTFCVLTFFDSHERSEFGEMYGGFSALISVMALIAMFMTLLQQEKANQKAQQSYKDAAQAQAKAASALERASNEMQENARHLSRLAQLEVNFSIAQIYSAQIREFSEGATCDIRKIDECYTKRETCIQRLDEILEDIEFEKEEASSKDFQI